MDSAVTTGRAALSNIESALADLRKEEARLTSELAGLTDRVGQRKADEAEALRDLARFKIENGGDVIAGRLDRASREAREAIAARETAVATLERDRTARAAALAEAERKLGADRAALDAVEDRIEALAAQLKESLARDEAHQKLVAAAAAAVAMEEAAVKKAETAEADRAAKATAYEADPLFIYLWRRKFGTAEYASRGLTRVLDRWVARLIDYAEARPAYALLTEIPVRLRTHAERVSAEADAAEAAVDESADKALARLAGEDLAARGEALAASIKAQEAAIGPLREEAGKLEQRAASFASGEDDAFKTAIEALSRSIAADDIAALQAEALRTPSPEDERFVAAIAQARNHVATLEADAAKLREQLAQVARRREELVGVARDFRQRGWDESGNTFGGGGDFLGNLITGFILGRIGRGDFWGRIERSHRGGGSIFGGGSSGGWGRSSGGGWGRSGGGFRTGGSFGGSKGGFRTGRKF